MTTKGGGLKLTLETPQSNLQWGGLSVTLVTSQNDYKGGGIKLTLPHYALNDSWNSLKGGYTPQNVKRPVVL